jgi:glutamine amidotransferase
LLDYGAGNLRSVYKALKFLGADVKLVSEASGMQGASGVVLPGVGAFDDCLNAMRRQELLEGCRDFVRTGKPFLGICVGYQALFDKSEEFNSCAAGLGLFRGIVKKFPEHSGLKVPQIGWNRVAIRQPNSPLFKGMADGTYFYFVHSYFPVPEDASIISATTDYGIDFASAVSKDNVHATQFHPEKSQQAGLQLLKNFVQLTA